MQALEPYLFLFGGGVLTREGEGKKRHFFATHKATLKGWVEEEVEEEEEEEEKEEEEKEEEEEEEEGLKENG